MVEVFGIEPGDSYAQKNPNWDRKMIIEGDEIAVLKQAAQARIDYRTTRGNDPLSFDERVVGYSPHVQRIYMKPDDLTQFTDVLQHFTEISPTDLPADQRETAQRAGVLATEITFANQIFEQTTAVTAGVDFDDWPVDWQ